MRKMRKAITPIISVVILLLITIALAGAAWTFLQGTLTSQISKAFSVPVGGAYCSNGVIRVTVVNIGTSNLAAEDFIIATVSSSTFTDGDAISTYISPDFEEMEPGKASPLLEIDCSDTCPRGRYDISIGTGSSAQQLAVTC